MKRLTVILTLFMVIMLTGTALAAKPVIKADRTYFDISTESYVLSGNVYVEVGNRIIKANQARVSIASLEVWASGGVSLTQDDIYFTGDSVYVVGLHKRTQISGGVNFTRKGLSLSADSVDFNWDTKVAVFRGNVTSDNRGSITRSDQLSYDIANNTIL